MKLKLKENPREWQKFTGVFALLILAVTFSLFRRRILPIEAVAAALGFGIVLVLAALIQPRWFRPLYRRGMTVSFHIGQFMGKILLSIFFLVVVTPLGILLRLCGKDLLQLKANSGATSYWQPARNSKNFEQQF